MFGRSKTRKEANVSIDWTLATTNLTSIAVLVFIFGFIAARLNSDVRIPEPVYQFISFYLLIGIGLKGGHALKSSSFGEIAIPAVTTIILGSLIPFAAFASLKFIRSLSDLDRGAIAAHYGSTSLVTFSAALIFLENHVIDVEGYATALLTLMEIPGIIVGVFLGSRHVQENVQWTKTFHEIITGKTVLLLVFGLLAGWITTEASYDKAKPLFIDLQSGLLVLFLLHLGYLAGSQWNEIKQVGIKIGIFALAFPIFAGFVGAAAGTVIGMSVGGATILAVLCASASYIAAPAAVSIGLPQANGALALSSSIGVTFPFNLIVGIPLYLEFAKLLAG